jgi:hypothetical protein
MDCRCIGLTVYGRDFPGAAADTAESPIASTQGGVGKLAAAAAAGALAGFDPGNRMSTIEHSYDRSGQGHRLECDRMAIAATPIRWPPYAGRVAPLRRSSP